MAETLRRVLSVGSSARLVEENVAEAGSPVLLLGGPGSGKTTLLFAAALEAAGEGRGPVLFLTRRPLQSLPRRTGAALDPLRLQVKGAGLEKDQPMNGACGAEWQLHRPMTGKMRRRSRQ